MTESRGSLLRSVHGLRAIAALMVVCHHAREQIDGFAAQVTTELGTAGVDIFFVISGVVMVVATSGRPMTRGTFLAHRIKRVVPLYWFVTVVTAAIALVAPALMKNTSFSWESLVQSLLFWPHWNADKGNLSPLVKLGWTLNFEMLFYVLFALFLPLRPLRRLAAVAAVLGLLIAINLAFQPMAAPLRFWGSAITLEFCLGMAVGIAFTRGALDATPRALAYGLIGLGLVALVWLADAPVDRVFAHGLPASAIVLGLVAAEAGGRAVLTGPAFAFLGNASYAIYLGHLFAVRAAGVAWHKLHLPETGALPVIGFMAVALAGGTIAGILLHLYAERPLANLIRRGVPGTRPRHSAGDYATDRAGEVR